MSCEKFQTVVNELAREENLSPQLARVGSPVERRDPLAGSLGEAPDLGWDAIPAGVVLVEANERADALAHIAECNSCSLRWEAQLNLTARLQTLAGEMKSLSASPQSEEEVLKAFRERVNEQVNVVLLTRPGQHARYLFAAIAALLLIIVGIFVLRSRVISRPEQQLAVSGQPKTMNSSSVPPEAIVQSSPIVPKKIATVAPARRARRNASRYLAGSQPSVIAKGKDTSASGNAANAAMDLINEEIATDFFPIGYGSTPNMQEGGQLLRVELPRAAVARFGLPVNMERTSERVKADVLVGADGLAQAIRFVF